MEKQGLKKTNINNGITLIALVITIITLLILAGVVIASLTGDNGLLARAMSAKDKTEETQAKEEIAIAWNAVQVEGIIENWDINKKAEELEKLLKDSTAEVDEDDIILEYKEYTATIDTTNDIITIGEGEEVATGPITIKKFSIKGTGTQITTPTIPDNFYYVGGTVNSGYVISDNASDENKYAGNINVGTTDLAGNQFVWIPVDQNQKITLKVICEENIKSIKLTDPVGSTIDLGTISGKTYSNTQINPTINGGYKVEVKTANHTESKTLVVRSLYAIDTFKDIPLASNTLSSYSETEDYTTSVNNYGGFYIGRYEAIRNNNSFVIQANKTVRINVSQTNALNYAKVYNAKCSLPTGAAWDRTLGWLVQTKNKDLADISSDSTSWGNYQDDDSTNNPAKTGMTSKAVSNNIYDLAGNVSEWTTQAYNRNGKSSRVIRGGDYRFLGYDYPASDRGWNDPSISSGFPFRYPLSFILVELSPLKRQAYGNNTVALTKKCKLT